MKLSKYPILLSILLSLLLYTRANAKIIYGPYQVNILKIYRADLMTVKVYIWPGLSKRMLHIKLSSINSPRLASTAATIIKDCEKKTAKLAINHVQQITKNKKVFIDSINPSKSPDTILGRMFVRNNSGDTYIGEFLLAKGLAYPYSKKKKPWKCK